MNTALRLVACLLLLLLLCTLAPATAVARNFQLRGDNDISGGIGVAGDVTDFTPGGFKWFNEYNRKLTELVWLNFQFNIISGGDSTTACVVNPGGNVQCSRSYRFGGTGLELAGGVKLKWRLRQIPLQIHAKFGGILNFLWMFNNEFFGVATGFRGGAGVRYFFVPTFGAGAELMTTFGPSFFEDPVGLEFYGAIDFLIGVEWRF